jgi:hypothetical protein
MIDPAPHIETYNEVLGLLDAACAKRQPIIADESMPTPSRNYLMSIWRSVGHERAALAEMERTTQELTNCRCED